MIENKLYKANRYTDRIEVVPVFKETEHYVTVGYGTDTTRWGSCKRIARERRVTDGTAFFKTWAEAKAWLVAFHENRKQALLANIQIVDERLKNLQAMSEDPEPPRATY